MRRPSPAPLPASSHRHSTYHIPSRQQARYFRASDAWAALLAARYLAARQLGDVIPLLFACTHVEHAVGGTHRSLREGHCFHPDVGNAFQPFPAGRMIPGNKSATAMPRRDGGGVLSLDRALHRAEIAGATRIWIRDEARGRQVSLLLLLQYCSWTSGRLSLIRVTCCVLVSGLWFWLGDFLFGLPAPLMSAMLLRGRKMNKD